MKLITVLLFTVIVSEHAATAGTVTDSRVFGESGQFTQGIEGPAVDSQGRLYAVNFQKAGTIGVVNEEGLARHFVNLPAGSTGNGIRFSDSDTMYVADYTGHNILKVEMQTKTISKIII